MTNPIHSLLSRIRPTTDATGLAAAAGIPDKAITKHYAWIDGKAYGVELQPRHYFAVVRALAEANGGVTIVGWFEIRPVGNYLEIQIPESGQVLSPLMGVEGFAHWVETGEIL
jgi:hypothetical protein